MSQVRTIKGYYNSDEDDIVQDFLVPCLSNCIYYKRAAGFFNSSSLITWSSILPKLARGDLKEIRILMSPRLDEDDIKLLEKCLSAGDKLELLNIKSNEIVVKAAQFLKNNDDKDLRGQIFCWLVANNKLHIKFSYSRDYDPRKLYHVKNGIFEFSDSEMLAFSGSLNESLSSHTLSNEEIEVFRSWEGADIERLQNRVERFEKEWNNQAKKWEVHELSESALDIIKRLAPDAMPTQGPEQTNRVSERVEDLKWRHQDEAVKIFLEKKFGVLEMATGTGKTHTSLKIATALFKARLIDSVIISTSGTDLLNQWYKNLSKLTQTLEFPLLMRRNYSSFKESDLFCVSPSETALLISRETLAPALKALPISVAAKTLLIHDEVHGLGSPSNRENLVGLSDAIGYRLGLSATPEREYDDEGTQFIEDHIGPVIYQFDLSAAIKRGILCPFNYRPLPYEIDDEDRQKIRDIYARKAASEKTSTPMDDRQLWIEISKVYKTSLAKLPIFEEFITGNKEFLKRAIIFVETKEYGERVSNILLKIDPSFHVYYDVDGPHILQDFAEGKIGTLITCHKISEGIDIRSLKNVILFSSARARLETVQRIGRCLRTDPDDPEKIANVIDFVRESEQNENADTQRSEWLTALSQLRREN